MYCSIISYVSYKFTLYCFVFLIQFFDMQRYEKNAKSHSQSVKKGVGSGDKKGIVFLFLFATAKRIFFNKIMHNFVIGNRN